MAKNEKKNHGKRDHSKSTAKSQAAAAPEIQRPSELQFIAGMVMLLVALAATATLVLAHMMNLDAPGCGPGSGCEAAANSVWGKIPGVDYPVSALGLAYFIAAFIGWIVSRSGVTLGFRMLVRVGVLGSLFYLGVMLLGKFNCKYCLAAHLANVAFWLIVENTRKAQDNRSLASLAAACAAFALGTIALFGADRWQKSQVEASKAQQLADSTQRIIERTTGTGSGGGSATAPANDIYSRGKVYRPEGGFTGRWRKGPENAPIRLVIISDYQCPDCKDIDLQVEQLLAQRSDISVSHKHYPMCTDCNVYMGKANMHMNACWAARAAEAAGIVGGNEAFWKMHHWLFQNGGRFETVAQLEPAFQYVGFTAQQRQQFLQTIETDQTLEPVKADIEEAHMLGLYFTPMIFINGVELRGFVKNPAALSTAITQIAARNPQPGSPSQDQPPLAMDKCVGDWLANPQRTLPTTPTTWPLGPADAKVKIEVWTDPQFSFNVQLDQAVRDLMAKRGDVQYIFRTFPSDNACNPHSRVKRVSPACLLAHASLAAGQLGGADAYWKFYEWTLKNPGNYTEQSLRAAAPELGLDPEEFMTAINSPEIKSLQLQQVNAISPFVRQGIPTVYVNGKWVSRWKFDDEVVLDEIVEEAGK